MLRTCHVTILFSDTSETETGYGARNYVSSDKGGGMGVSRYDQRLNPKSFYRDPSALQGAELSICYTQFCVTSLLQLCISQ